MQLVAFSPHCTHLAFTQIHYDMRNHDIRIVTFVNLVVIPPHLRRALEGRSRKEQETSLSKLFTALLWPASPSREFASLCRRFEAVASVFQPVEKQRKHTTERASYMAYKKRAWWITYFGFWGVALRGCLRVWGGGKESCKKKVNRIESVVRQISTVFIAKRWNEQIFSDPPLW